MATPKHATLADFLTIHDNDRLELIAGEVVEKSMSGLAHASAEGNVREAVAPFRRKLGGPHGPGGWWIGTEVHVVYTTGEVFCHDVAGWRRDQSPEMPRDFPVALRPDWVCEIVSPTHEKRDFVDKLGTLQRDEVPHYWLLHPEERMLIVYRWSPKGYVAILTASAGQTVRAQPFDAIEIRINDLLGIEDDEA